MPPTMLYRNRFSSVRIRRCFLEWGCVLLIAGSGCGDAGGPAGANVFFGEGIKGSGVLKTEQRPVTGFSRIDVGGIVKLEWRADGAPSLEVTVEDNLLPLLITEVAGDTLKIHFNENVNP